MIPEFNPNIVLLATGVAFIGIYLAVCAAEKLRGEFLKYRKPTLAQMLPSFLMLGVAIGGVAFWGVHSIGMASMTLKDDNGNVVPIKYNIGVSVFGILLGFLAEVFGMVIGCNDSLYAKSKAEILEIFVESISIDEILNASEFQVLFLLATRKLTYIIVGGSLAGAGLIGSHFIIIALMQFPGYIVWNAGIVVAVIVTSILAVIPAYWLFFRLLSIYPDIELLRIAIAFIGAIGICGMHYFAIFASDFKIGYSKTTTLSWDAGTMSQDDMLYPILLSAMILLWVITMILFADLRTKLMLIESIYRRCVQMRSCLIYLLLQRTPWMGMKLASITLEVVVVEEEVRRRMQ